MMNPLTMGQSASLTLQGRIKRGGSYLEPKVPPNGGGKAPLKRAGFFMLRVAGWLAGLGCLMVAGLAQAKPQQIATTHVLVAHPIVASLAETLAESTRIKIVRTAPDTLPPSRWNSYFSGRGAATLARDAARADAVLTLRSLWSDDPLYALVRRRNIRTVEIDAARPIDGALPGIALYIASEQPASALLAQPWLDPSNLGRMADIVAADLQKLVPSARAALSRRLAAFKQHWVTLAAQAEQALAQAPNLSVIVLSDRLDYLASTLNLDVVPIQLSDANWDAVSINTLVTAIKENDVAAVLCQEALPEAVQQAVRIAAPDTTLLVLQAAVTTRDVETLFTRVVKALTQAA